MYFIEEIILPSKASESGRDYLDDSLEEAFQLAEREWGVKIDAWQTLPRFF